MATQEIQKIPKGIAKHFSTTTTYLIEVIGMEVKEIVDKMKEKAVKDIDEDAERAIELLNYTFKERKKQFEEDINMLKELQTVPYDINKLYDLLSKGLVRIKKIDLSGPYRTNNNVDVMINNYGYFAGGFIVENGKYKMTIIFEPIEEQGKQDTKPTGD